MEMAGESLSGYGAAGKGKAPDRGGGGRSTRAGHWRAGSRRQPRRARPEGGLPRRSASAPAEFLLQRVDVLFPFPDRVFQLLDPVLVFDRILVFRAKADGLAFFQSLPSVA